VALATMNRTNSGKEMSEERFVEVGKKMANRYGEMFATSAKQMTMKK
jgi:hypothetical protein